MADLPVLGQVRRPITLIPVGLKEAALDSPTFRSGFTHFSEQLELVEKWLEGYVRCISKLTHEIGAFETLINGFLAQTVPPSLISEAVIDHDYTLLALKRYGDGAREFWTATMLGLKRMEANMVEPIKIFLQHDLRPFRDIRRNLDQTQRQFDSLQSRFSGQAKTKEASSLREDAFQLHEARKAYLKASMDFSAAAPQLRMALDKMLVRVFSDQWRDMRGPQQRVNGSIERWSNDIERVRGWSREMENGEKSFKREFLEARKHIEESAELAVRPSRELDDYAGIPGSTSTLKGPSISNLQTPGTKTRPVKSEKQGWLNLRTVSGKPSRTIWLRRWFYVKNGIFGWLVQGSRSGGVEESDRIGVLLCNVKPGNADDRRFVFEVKTKDTTIVVQAETHTEMMEWLAAFDIAKQKALEDPASTESPGLGPRAHDPAFAISPPSAPEFAASAADSGMPHRADDNSNLTGPDRSSTLPVPGSDVIVNRNSFDVASQRRPLGEKDNDTSRDPASRIIQKLDLHRKATGDMKSPGSAGSSGSGIASLIAASHSSMPVGPGALPNSPPPDTPKKSPALLPTTRDLPTSSLAPNTLVNPPASTTLSSAAVIVNGERGIGIGRIDASGGMPSGVLANVWGSTNWGHLNRLSRNEQSKRQERSASLKLSNPPSPLIHPSNTSQDASPPKSALAGISETSSLSQSPNKSPIVSAADSPHRKTLSLDTGDKSEIKPPEYPNYYPLQLKTQDAQFRLLFPSIPREEKLVLVFKATWNPNEQQEFPGRVYVTTEEMYFYSNHCGMTLISSIGLGSISEVTAATGRDCDFIFCHLKEEETHSGYTRITIKTFLESLKLLKRRLNFLVQNHASQQLSIEEVMKSLIKMEQDDPESSPSMDSWENISVNTPVDGGATPKRNASYRDQRDLKANVLIDRGLYGDNLLQLDGAVDSKTFKLPKQPIVYTPSGMDKLAVEREFEISPKALFHVMFGDKSAVWQLLYHERQAQRIKQGPWTQTDHGHLRRDFDYQLEYLDFFRRVRQAKVEDHQMVEVANEHLLYVVSDRKSPWHFPYRDSFLLLTKVVITHLAKSKCKLAVYVKVDWLKPPPYARGIIAEAALRELALDALDLTDVIAEQVRNFASAHGRTKKAIQIFGQVGVQTQTSEFAGSEAPLKAQLRRSKKKRTLTALAFESAASMAESVVTSAAQIVTRFVMWIWRTVNANSILICILAVSVLVNIVFSSTSTSTWWQERRARKFMSHLGVGPDLSISKAVYIHDLTDATSLDLDLDSSPDNSGNNNNNNPCRNTFNTIMNLPSPFPPNTDKTSYSPPSTLSPPSLPQSASLHRFQKTRHHLGQKRHDLLVAMRVVNSIEREMVQAEWESWLAEEGMRCSMMEGIIHSKSREEGRKDQQGAEKYGSNRTDEEIRSWHREYCASCRREQERVGMALV
ncbi:SNF1-interacting protein [Lecanora helva]